MFDLGILLNLKLRGKLDGDSTESLHSEGLVKK